MIPAETWKINQNFARDQLAFSAWLNQNFAIHMSAELGDAKPLLFTLA